MHRGLPTEGWWIWVGVAVQVFAIALYNVLTWLCHAYLQREISRYSRPNLRQWSLLWPHRGGTVPAYQTS